MDTSSIEGRKTDYRVFYILGVCIMGLAVILATTISPAYFGIMGAGAVFLVLGTSNVKRMEDPESEQR